MNNGIVGHEAAKFTGAGEQCAREIIRRILSRDPTPVLVSGHCHLGGIDIWAEEEADNLGIEKMIFAPKSKTWEGGYKPRNLQIANASAIVHVIVVTSYPPSYSGMLFDYCYHCHTKDHIKSGACWTAKQGQKLGRPAEWYLVAN